MPIYIMLSTLTDEGRKTIKENPERIKEVNKEIERMGAKVLTQYVVLGKYDFINVIEAPDNEIIAKVSIELGSRGTVQIVTLSAIPIFEFLEKMESPHGAGGAAQSPIPDEYEEKMY
ncbi:MAG: GYD domain protein [Syntrophorhabdus sp. PtaU1.Bin002]|nr:MAG: GYD domain protein [Syntrophorhabdus sp. PtaB.Bin006]OPY73831.1 MAG: GYD domain protein [Syntrophorhabdus sp. PtaU1.Bin002]